MPITSMPPQPSKAFTINNVKEFFTRHRPYLHNMGDKARGYCTVCAQPHSVFYSLSGISVCIPCAKEAECLPDDPTYEGEFC